jgi:HSP20 family protein
MALVRWRPTRDIMNIADEMNRMLDRFFGGTGLLDEMESMVETEWAPRVNIAETRDNYLVEVEVPGMKKEDIHISLKDNLLTIEGERKHETASRDRNYHRRESFYGKFSRSFTLPDDVLKDKIDASYENGILTITLPKSEEAKPKEIEVKIK